MSEEETYEEDMYSSAIMYGQRGKLAAQLRASEPVDTSYVEGQKLLQSINKQAFNFTAKAAYNGEILQITLDTYQDKKYVVLFFYPLNFSFVCPTEIKAFNEQYEKFAALNAEVLGVSVDSEYSHLAWTQMDEEMGGIGNIRYPLISDLNKRISEKYDVLTSDGTAARGLFIIDKKGFIQFCAIYNQNIGRSVDETLRTLQAIQHAQENPEEVCQADWQPGDDAIKTKAKPKKG